MSARRRHPFYRFSLLVVVFIGCLLAAYTLQQLRWIQRLRAASDDHETTFSSYPGFGIRLPASYPIHGIDVSRYQKRINWRLARQMKVKDVQLRFAFIKATEGADLTDEQFARNWRKSAEAGFVRGAYHFFRQETDAARQAAHFLATVKLRRGDLPPVLDVEQFSGTDAQAFLEGVRIWLKLVEAHYGVKPIIYTNAHFYNTWLYPAFEDYPLWVAQYRNEKPPAVEKKWWFWQHNEGGRVNGIHSYVDFNVFAGTDSAFHGLLLP